MAGLFGAPEESEAVRSLCNSGTLAAPALAAEVGWNRLPRPHARPFRSGRTAAFAASIFAALRLTGRLGSGSLVPLLARPSGQGLLALASPPSEVTHSQVYWLVLPEEARATGVIPC